MNLYERERMDCLGRLDEEVLPYRRRSMRRRETDSHSALQRVTAAGLAMLFIGLLGSFGLFIATAQGPAERVLARAVQTFTEVDRLLVIHGADLRTQAQAQGATSVSLGGFPIHVALTPAEVLHASPQQLQVLLDRRAAEAIYTRGVQAFVVPGGRGTNETGPLLSSAWTMNKALSLLSPRAHARLQIVWVLFALGTVVLGLLFCLQVGGYGRLVGLGLACAVGAVVAGLLTLFAWLFVQFSDSGAASPLGAAAWGMLADVTWTMVVIDGAVCLLCMALIATGLAFAALDRQPNLRSDVEAPVRFAPRLERRRRPFD